jgi:hypothetical protein
MLIFLICLCQFFVWSAVIISHIEDESNKFDII